MPVFKQRVVFEMARNVKAFLNLDAGVTRGTVPDFERMFEQAQNQIKQKNRQLERIQGQLRDRLAYASQNNSGRPATRNEFHAVRQEIAFRYLTGSGLEIGALHQPLKVPSEASVRYVDRMTVDELREQYPELSECRLTPVDIIEDGETLSSIPDASVDFVIVNHMIEHCQNPIGALENQLRVLKPDGILYMAVPDKRLTFDYDRPITPLEHVIRDYTEGPEWSRESHFEEWARVKDEVPEGEVAARAQQLAEIDFSIHFHVWTQKEFLELLQYCRSNLESPFEIELLQKNEIELIFILRKQPQELEGTLDLQRAFEVRGPWITKFAIAGNEYGGEFDAMHDPRVDQFFDSFPAPRRIMELGSLEGGHTFNLASRPSVEYVLGIEGRQANVDKAKFVQHLLGVQNVEFATANLEETNLASLGDFDAVFCSGLLYHLPEPWKLIEQIARVSPGLFIWTHYAKGDLVNSTVRGLEGMTYKEHGLVDPLSGMSPTSFWPTLDGLQDMLKEYGFTTVNLIEDQPDHPHGPAITLAAIAS